MRKLLKVVSAASLLAIASTTSHAGERRSVDVSVGDIGIGADVGIGRSGIGVGADVGVGDVSASADVGVGSSGVGASADVGVGGLGGGLNAGASVGIGGGIGTPPGATAGTAVPASAVPPSAMAANSSNPLINLVLLKGMVVVSSDRKMLGVLDSIEHSAEGFAMRIRVADALHPSSDHVMFTTKQMPKIGDVIRLPISLRSFVSQI